MRDEPLAVLAPCAFAPYKGAGVRTAFVAVRLKDGELSLTGVHGPMANGDAVGGCGQIDSTLWEALAERNRNGFRFHPGWNQATLERLLEIWRDWHLNHMRPYDEAMLRDGWRAMAASPMLGYKFSLSSAAWAERQANEKAAIAGLADGDYVRWGSRARRLSKAPLSYQAWIREGEAEPMPLPDYERSRSIHGNGIEPAERKTLGWLRPSEHPDGLLGKVHPESGNGYGSQWYRHEIPESVLAFLASLPLAHIKPAWV